MEVEAIRGCRKDIWLDWIPTTAHTAQVYSVKVYNAHWHIVHSGHTAHFVNTKPNATLQYAPCVSIFNK